MKDARATTAVLGFPGYRPQAERLAAAVGAVCEDVDIRHFPDGESLVRLPERVPEHVIVCCTLNDPNRQLIELALTSATARTLGAARVSLVAPYLCYMRQDKAFRPGEAVSQRIIGEFLARRFDALVTVDPHLHRTHRLQDAVPNARALAVTAAPVMAAWLTSRPWEPLIVGPDEESEQWVRRIASAGGYEYCVARKQRFGDRDVRITLPHRDFAGRDVVLVDDVISSGHTIGEAARQIVGKGAASVVVLVCHALFAAGALEHVEAAGVTEIVSTDSVPHPSNQLHLDHLLSEGLGRAWSNGNQAAQGG